MDEDKKNLISSKRVCVIGLGYVGLTLAATLSRLGYKVFGVERQEDVVKRLKEGLSHFYEPGMNEMLKEELSRGFEILTSVPEDPSSEIYILAIGTPVRGEEKVPDFSDLASSVENVARVLKKGDMVILRSTVPPGTTREFVIPRLEDISGLKVESDFYVAFGPERTVEGRALEELLSLPQVVGGYGEKSLNEVAIFFESMSPRVIRAGSLEVAEMVKLVNNLYRDVSFAFANEMAMICDKFNLDTHEVIDAANSGYERSAVPKPSPGVGGYCLTKDPHILYHAVGERGFVPRLIREGRSINKYMPHHVAGKIFKFLDDSDKKASETKIFLMGLAFKGNPPTSDVRFSPSIKLCRILQTKNIGMLHAYDPLVDDAVFEKEGLIKTGVEEGFRNADVIVVNTNHPDFAKINVSDLLATTKKSVLFFDGWKMFDPADIIKIGHVKYANLGFSTM